MFSEKLQALRMAKMQSQKELADKLGVSKSMVSFYESGDRLPSYDVLMKISRIFNVTTDYILGAERKRTLDVSELSEDDIKVLNVVIDALKEKKRK